jgi:hypothetical protein
MFFEMLSAWSASFLAGMTRISTEMNHRACRERETTEPSTDDAAAVVAESLFSPFQVYPRQPDHIPIADNARTNCAQGAIVVTDLINIHEVSRSCEVRRTVLSGQLAQFEVLAPR